MATTEVYRCNQCFKEFGKAGSLRGHANKTGHAAGPIEPEPDASAVEAAAPVPGAAPNDPRRKGQKRTPAEKVADGKAANRNPCECGCGGTPAGRKSRYLPGHDAKHYSRIRRENGEIA